jgi:hypothetical protein
MYPHAVTQTLLIQFTNLSKDLHSKKMSKFALIKFENLHNILSHCVR